MQVYDCFRRWTLGAATAVGICTALLPSVSAQEITIKYANVMAASHDTSKGVDKFAELLEQKTEGRIKVVHFPGGQLGSDTETYQAAQMGMLQIAGGSYANLVNITRAFEVLHLPFIFENRAQAHAALDSPAVQEMINKELDKVGLRWLMTFEYGFRDINTAGKEVKVPADMAGLKMRASRSPTEIAGIKAFGASAITVDWPEVYNALKFKIVDGEAQPFGTMVSARHHEVIKNDLIVNWQYYGFVGMISTKQWNAYPDWAKQAIKEAAAEAQAYHRNIWEEEHSKAREEYLKAGGKITELAPAQKTEWITLGRSTWPDSGVSQLSIDTVRRATGAL